MLVCFDVPVIYMGNRHCKVSGGVYQGKYYSGLDGSHLKNHSSTETTLKVVSATYLLVCFVSLKEDTSETKKNVFYFTSKALFILEITFQTFKCYDVIRCPSMKHQTHFTE